MSFGVVYYDKPKILPKIKQVRNVNELDILLPHFNQNASKRYGKRVLKILNKDNIDKVVIHNDILKNREFCNVLFENKKDFINGRNMYKSIIIRVLKDITSLMKVELKQLKALMLVEDYSVQNVDLIKNVAKEVKSLTIVTTDKDKFDSLIKELFDKQGIVLNIVEKNVNSFKNVNVLINVDFLSFDMNKIEIPSNTLIICGFAELYKTRNGFEGIVIKKIDVIDTNNENQNIDGLSLCEAKIYSYLRKIKENDRMFEREGFKINGYFGENGKIRLEDFMKLGRKISPKIT